MLGGAGRKATVGSRKELWILGGGSRTEGEGEGRERNGPP